MAQLSDDCFAFGGPLLRLDAALDDLTTRLPIISAVETVALSASLGRVLAEDVVAPFSIPAFSNSAVDGYAVSSGSLRSGHALPVTQRIAAGARGVGALPEGEAARIFTGAMLPDGADIVFMQEDVRVEGGMVHLPPGLKPGANCRVAGEDYREGAVIVEKGTRLKPQHVAGLAAAGLTRVRFYQRLRVGVFSTGNEIIEAGHPLPPGSQYDANRPMLLAFLAARGMEPVDLGILADDAGAIARALDAAAEHCDALLSSGGVSTGEEDHVKAALGASGRLDFWRLAIKPGRPVAMGHVGGKAFIGMPGNPAAVFVTFTRFVGPVLDRLAGAMPLRPAPFLVPAAFDYRKKRDRREYLRVALMPGEAGLVAQRFMKDGAALISSLIEANALAELEEDRERVDAGETIAVLPFAALLS